MFPNIEIDAVVCRQVPGAVLASSALTSKAGTTESGDVKIAMETC
jgi:hypothetical protein